MSYSPSIHYTQNAGQVYHISEESGIDRFEPRPIRPGHPLRTSMPVVWAIGGRLMHNYLLPRDCPRVAFHAGPDTSAVDRKRHLSQTAATFVIAIESAWLVRAMTTRLFIYTLPSQSFVLVDPVADYWTSDVAVSPITVSQVDSPLAELNQRPVELRLTPSLWPLYDAVTTSTLCFSCIRMANAAPRQD
jgi:hypothetical protein